MTTLLLEQPVPVYALAPQEAVGSGLFQLARAAGECAYRADMLLPHRKDYYLLVFVQRGGSRHWVDMTPYVVQNNTLYFTTPSQLQVKEHVQPKWGDGRNLWYDYRRQAAE